MSKSTRDIYKALRDAYNNNRGIHLTADEVDKLVHADDAMQAVVCVGAYAGKEFDEQQERDKAI